MVQVLDDEKVTILEWVLFKKVHVSMMVCVEPTILLHANHANLCSILCNAYTLTTVICDVLRSYKS